MVHRSLRELPGSDGLREEVNSRGMLKVSSCQAFDYLLQAALNAQVRLCFRKAAVKHMRPSGIMDPISGAYQQNAYPLLVHYCFKWFHLFHY